jgi:hypothetical protein
LQESAGGGVAEGWFEVPEFEAAVDHASANLGHEGFAFVEGDEGHLELDGEGVGEEASGSSEDVGFVALDVELEEDATGGVGGRDDVIEAVDGDDFFAKVVGFGRGGEVGVEHGEDGTREGVGGDVDFGVAGVVAEGHTVGDLPEGVGCGGLKEGGVRGCGGFEGDDSALIADGSAVPRELAGVGADVEDEIDVELREEEAVAEILRAVDAGLADLVAGGFGEGAQGVFEGLHERRLSCMEMGE